MKSGHNAAWRSKTQPALVLALRFGLLSGLLAGLLPGPGVVEGTDAPLPLEVFAGPATFESIAIRWPVLGDDDGDARVDARFRREGTSRWRDSLPLIPTARKGSKKLFAGSLLGLEADTRYEVHLTLLDSGAEPIERRLLVATRPPILEPEPARTVEVFPDKRTGFQEALDAARPGDLIRLHAGLYRGPFVLRRSGTESQPIVIGAAGDGDVLLTADVGPEEAVLTGEPSVDSVWVQGLILRSNGTALQGSGSHWVVRDNYLLGGLVCGRRGWFVAENTLVGRYENWRVRTSVPGGTGIRALGQGHVIARNRISRFWDGISTAELGLEADDLVAASFSPDGGTHGSDVLGNTIFEINDDAIEIDRAEGNFRVRGNRLIRSLVGLSVQDSVGPVYAIRNVLADNLQDAWKLRGAPKLLLLHNTSLNWHVALRAQPSDFDHSYALNNLFLGAKAGIELGGNVEAIVWNHNGYNQLQEPLAGPIFGWRDPGPGPVRAFSTLEDFQRDTGLEPDGLVLDLSKDFDPAISLRPDPDDTYRFRVPELAPDSAAVDAGVVIPGVNDDYSGKAPDLGAFELGSSPGPGSSALEPAADVAGSAPRPIRLSARERLIRYLDVNNLGVDFIAAWSFSLGVAAGLVLALAARYFFGRRRKRF